jgi:hypothetical protein
MTWVGVSRPGPDSHRPSTSTSTLPIIDLTLKYNYFEKIALTRLCKIFVMGSFHTYLRVLYMHLENSRLDRPKLCYFKCFYCMILYVRCSCEKALHAVFDTVCRSERGCPTRLDRSENGTNGSSSTSICYDCFDFKYKFYLI